MIAGFRKVCLLAIAVAFAAGQSNSRSEMPDAIKAPPGEEVTLQVHATGFQIYVCQTGADAKPAWTLKAPEAELHDAQGAVVGHHFAGPAWKHNDGSEVHGKAVAKFDSSDSIPWLLVSVTSHSGSGKLSGVTTIQRLHTTGGLPPSAAECDSSKQGAEFRSSYAADYYFYAPRK